MPPAPQPNRPLDLVLHVGAGKTGTSSIQAFMRGNRDRLASLGTLYPRSPGGARHARLVLFASPDEELVNFPHWSRQRHQDPARFRKVFRRRLLREIEESGLSRVLLSDEELFKASPPALQRLATFTGEVARNLRVVCYLRRQDDHMVSRYQQGVKIGWVSRLDAWAHEDMTDLYDYATRLIRHEELLRPTELVVRRYEPGAFSGGSLLQDFLEAAGIDARVDELAQISDRNASLDAETVEFLRLLNLHRVEQEGAVPGLIDNRELVSRLSKASTGPTLSLPGPELDRFMAQWDQTNRQVAERFLGDPTAELFREPRRNRETITDQRLDPASLDKLFELSQLPETLHRPLRRLAEREGRVR